MLTSMIDDYCMMRKRRVNRGATSYLSDGLYDALMAAKFIVFLYLSIFRVMEKPIYSILFNPIDAVMGESGQLCQHMRALA